MNTRIARLEGVLITQREAWLENVTKGDGIG